MKILKKILRPMDKKKKLFLFIMLGLLFLAFLISFMAVQVSINNAQKNFQEDLSRKAGFLAGIIDSQENLSKENITYIKFLFLEHFGLEQGNVVIIDDKGEKICASADSLWVNEHVLLEKMNKEGGLLMFPSAGSNMDLFIAFRYLKELDSWLILQEKIDGYMSSMKRRLIGEASMISIISLLCIGVIIYFLVFRNMGRYSKKLEDSQKELKTTREALRASERLADMGQLSAGIAHAVSNPLGVITMHTHILKEEVNKDSSIYSDIELITEQADRCKGILSGLLNFARTSKVVLQETDVREMMNMVFDEVRIPSHVKFNYKTRIENPVVYLDTRQIIQAVRNLLNNAVEVVGKEGEIEVEVISGNTNLTVIIKDNGPGIPKDNQAKMFEPFFSTKDEGRGAGLGLAVSYGIIKMHKGKINVDSQSSNKWPTGTTITVEIPVNNLQV